MSFGDDVREAELPDALPLEDAAARLALPVGAVEVMAARGLFPGAWLDEGFGWRVPEGDVLAVASLARGAA